MAPSRDLASKVVADRYEVLDTIGRGGFGVVWRAFDTLLQRHVAVKEIHLPAFLDDDGRADVREKVLHEARAAARLDHPGAITVFDVLDQGGNPFIVMELVDAPNLSELIARRGPLPPAEAARIGVEVLEVLRAAHARGIVHRDVKPANVMVGENGRVRLGDFGVAAILDDPTVTSSGVPGSAAYMAPEQATSKGGLPESDLWSLGATLYFAVEGRPPFDKGAPLPTLTSVVHDPPRPAERAGPLRPVLDGLLVKDPRARMAASRVKVRLAQVAAARSDDTAVLPVADVAAPPTAEVPPPTADVAAPPTAEVPPPADVAPLPSEAAPPPANEVPPPTDVAPPTAAERPARPEPPPVPTQPAPAALPVPPGPPSTPTEPRRPGRRVEWAVLAVLVLTVTALAAVGVATRDTDQAQPPATAPGSPPSSEAPVTSPSGWTAYTDPQTGFTISHPKGWTVRTNGTLTDFRDPATGAYLRVDHVQPPRPSPEEAWYELEQSFAAEHANYRRIRIEPTTYGSYRAALWEFTYTDGGADLRAADLGFITPRYGFALYIQTRTADWDRLEPVFRAFKDSFKAPS